MKIIETIAIYLKKTNKKDFEKMIFMFVFSLGIISFLSIYIIYNESSNIVRRIKKLEKLVNRSNYVISENKIIEIEKKRLMEILNRNKDFSINSFFEQFCQQHGISAQPNWSPITIPVEGNDKFEEIVLTSVFKNQTTENLIKIVEALDKNEMVYIKDLTIRKSENNKINYQITMATIKTKRFLEEGF